MQQALNWMETAQNQESKSRRHKGKVRYCDPGDVIKLYTSTSKHPLATDLVADSKLQRRYKKVFDIAE